MGQEPQLPKPTGQLVGELLESLQVLRDALDGLSLGQTHQLIPLSGQLRALLLERRKDAHALLLDLSELLGLEPHLYVMDGVNKAPSVPGSPLFHLAGFPFSLQQEIATQHKIDLTDLAQHKLILFEGQTFSTREVIEFFANRSGGAHYSRSMPEPFAKMLTLGVPETLPMRQLLGQALQQIGAVVYRTGLDVVRQLTDVTMFLDLALPSTKAGFVLDAQYPGTHMRISLRIAKGGRLILEAVGMDGRQLACGLHEVLDWSVPHLVQVSLRHDERLASALRLALDDGSVQAEARQAGPLFLPSDVHEYDVFVNQARDGTRRPGATALAEWAVFRRSAPGTIAESYAYFAERMRKVNRKAVLYRAGGVGLAPSGHRDLQHSGPVVMTTMARAVAKAKPQGAEA